MEGGIQHDLHDFMRQVSNEMSEEYVRIQKRVGEDPGTAGDQGEENWAELFREWLPPNYKIVTKGRIISHDGRTSPQIDVIVLKDIYPERLVTKKLYLAAGVAAAFECKITLTSAHISKAMETSATIKNLYTPRRGTPYKELHAPIIYGLLAHSHSWKQARSAPEDNITGNLIRSDLAHITHPREALDLICVADLGTWTLGRLTFFGPQQLGYNDDPGLASIYGPSGSSMSYYVKHSVTHEGQTEHFTPIGALIYYLSHKLAWENPSLRDLADYYSTTNLAGGGMGHGRRWDSSIYSDDIRGLVVAGRLSNGVRWDEWSIFFQ